MPLAVAQPHCKISRLVSHIAQQENSTARSGVSTDKKVSRLSTLLQLRVTHHENPSHLRAQIQLSCTWSPSRRPHSICRRTNGPRYGFDWQKPARHLCHILGRERAGAVRPARSRLSRCRTDTHGVASGAAARRVVTRRSRRRWGSGPSATRPPPDRRPPACWHGPPCSGR